MAVGMGFAFRITGPVGVLMVFVMHVAMFMLHRFVSVKMFMSLSQVQPKAKRHESAGGNQLKGNMVFQQHNSQNCADEGRQREIGSGSGCAQMTQAQHEQDKAHPVAQKSDDAGAEQDDRARQFGAHSESQY
ncbi:hypothetical protein ABAC460_17100 [Asticcacaulis sp. AC460]|nr:hypothetical protein ABAC460_17100 [Asticcacaulis sp. AC460]